MLSKLHYVYRAHRYRLLVDPAELRYVCDTLRPGQVAVDAGCHKGAYTYWMRRCVGSTGAVFAFEPQPRQVDYLRAVFAAMRYANVTLVPQGLSNATGRLPLHIPAGSGETHLASFERGGEQGAGSEEQRARGREPSAPSPSPFALRPPLPAPCSVLPVDVTTLDDFFWGQPREPDFLKIDVEGHELALFEGGRHTLETHRPTILVECEARHRPDGDVRPVFELLQSLGYRGSFFERGRRRPLAEFDPVVHQRVDPRSPHLPRGYVNNFAFEPGT
jgi:FkbM family methyltransferase